ncbi:hypothetical protein [Streptomyces collinus]
MLYYLTPLSAALALVTTSTYALIRRDRRTADACLDREGARRGDA